MQLGIDWLAPLLLSLKLSLVSTLLLVLLAVPLAQWLNQCRSAWGAVVEALVALPIVLPPTVIGFYLLLAFSPQQGLGAWLQQQLDFSLAFSFSGLVLASIIYSLPFAVRPLQAVFMAVPGSQLEASSALGASPWQSFRHLVLPASGRGVLAAAALAFAHTMGEFGVVLMVGGNVPGVSRVASIALYDEVQALNYAAAHVYAAILLAFSFCVMLAVGLYQRRHRQLW